MVTHTHHLDDANDRQEAHDALAELFLGELRTVAAHDAAMGLSPRPSPHHPPTGAGPLDQPTHPTHAPHLHIHPAHPHTPHPTPIAPPSADAGHARGHPTPRRLEAERVIAGHLPLGAAPWITHHARVAAEDGPVALVRASAGHIRVDLYGEPGDEMEAPAPTPLAALIAVRDCGARLLVVTESEPLEDGQPLTLLMGADEAAVVDGYRRIKDLATSTARISIAVVGAAPAKACAAFDRLRDASLRFLGVRVLIAGAPDSYQQVTGGPLPRTLYHGPCAEPTDRLVAVAKAAPGPERLSGRAVPHTSTTATTLHARARGEDAEVEGSQAEHLAGGFEVAEPILSGVPVPGASQLLLASHVAGLTCMSARCPAAPEVEFAVDRTGRLHALAARHESGGTAESASAVESLAAAAAWAEANLAVLALTLPEGGGLVAAAPVQHLFTRHAPRERRLLDSGIRVHALASVDRSRSPDWVCLELN
ncbi:MAG: hypothetical protein ACT4PL_02680 [Phycisphaerales bacterium]